MEIPMDCNFFETILNQKTTKVEKNCTCFNQNWIIFPKILLIADYFFFRDSDSNFAMTFFFISKQKVETIFKPHIAHAFRIDSMQTALFTAIHTECPWTFFFFVLFSAIGMSKKIMFQFCFLCSFVKIMCNELKTSVNIRNSGMESNRNISQNKHTKKQILQFKIGNCCE